MSDPRLLPQLLAKDEADWTTNVTADEARDLARRCAPVVVVADDGRWVVRCGHVWCDAPYPCVEARAGLALLRFDATAAGLVARVEESTALIDALGVAVTQLRALHRLDDRPDAHWCAACHAPWPCPSARFLYTAAELEAAAPPAPPSPAAPPEGAADAPGV